MKKFKLVTVCVLAVIMVFAFTTTVFADWAMIGNVKKGDISNKTILIQRLLYQIPGYFNALTDIDGNFGKDTDTQVIKFQENNNLDDDGIVGKKTWAKFSSAQYAGQDVKVTYSGNYVTLHFESTRLGRTGVYARIRTKGLGGNKTEVTMTAENRYGTEVTAYTYTISGLYPH